MNDLNPKALLTRDGMNSPARELCAERGIPIIELRPESEAGRFTILSFEPGHRPETIDFALNDDVALVLRTSGTTAQPKIVPLTQKNLCASAQHHVSTLRLSEAVRCLNVMPLFHVHGLISAPLTFPLPHPTFGEDVVSAVTMDRDAEVEEIRSFAFSKLADFKVPSQIIRVNSIPRGATGKPQRRFLANALAGALRPERELPRDSFEQHIALIWAEVLGHDEFGVLDNFFVIGGDSIGASIAASRMRSVFNVDFPMVLIFKEPTLARQAVLVRKMLREVDSA